MCAVMLIVMLFFTIVFGPSMMFTSMKGKHNDQTLLSLPASNFEKYLMRYSTWIIILPLYLVAFFFADAIQYLVNMLIGTDHVMFVTTRIIQLLNENAHTDSEMVNSIVVTCIWTHSWYALGSTFFRSHKFAWILTTVVIIVVCMLCIWLLPDGTGYSDKDSAQVTFGWDVFYAVWFLGNFWLSYRLFCRQQVIGKFVNL